MCGHQARQGAALVQEPPKHDPLINWPTWGHVTIWKIYISTFAKFTANKLTRLLGLGRMFSRQRHKSSPTSCFFYFYLSSVFLDGLARGIFKYLSSFCFECVWPGSQIIIWYTVCFQPIFLEINSNGGLKQEHLEFSSSATKNISRLVQCLWPPNLAGWWFTMRDSHTSNRMTLWLSGLDNSTTKVAVTIKLGRMVAQLDGVLSIKLHDALITWSCDITWKAKPLFLHYHSAYGHKTW